MFFVCIFFEVLIIFIRIIIIGEFCIVCESNKGRCGSFKEWDSSSYFFGKCGFNRIWILNYFLLGFEDLEILVILRCGILLCVVIWVIYSIEYDIILRNRIVLGKF